jgi:bis(5'-adenosyl)-triphosphatase
VFAESKHCFAFVNLKPILPGHVLVSTKRVVPRFTSLESEEVADLWTLAQQVGEKLERFHQASSLTLTIQDGPEAGQTVPHVHIHILPRKGGDFENNDEVYDAIDQASEDVLKQLEGATKGTERKKNLDEDRKPRTREEMSEEAKIYRTLFGKDCC